MDKPNGIPWPHMGYAIETPLTAKMAETLANSVILRVHANRPTPATDQADASIYGPPEKEKSIINPRPTKHYGTISDKVSALAPVFNFYI